MKRWLFLVPLVLGGIGLAQTENEPMVEAVAFADVAFTRVGLVDGATRPILRVEGFIFHSSMAVGRVRLERDGDGVRVLVSIGLVGPGSDGNFDVDVVLDRPDGRVLFGPTGEEIWPKKPTIFTMPEQDFDAILSGGKPSMTTSDPDTGGKASD